LVDLIFAGKITPGDVFDKTLSLDDAAAGYAAMDRREAIKVMLKP
jgi:putative dehydrogenase